jgi:hypothetical protein
MKNTHTRIPLKLTVHWQGWIDDIVSDRDAAVATGRTVEIAFRRAMDKAEEILEHEEVPEDPRRRASIDHRASRHRSR